MIRKFNCEFFNKEYFKSHPRNAFRLLFEDNRVVKDTILDDVIEFCTNGEIAKQYGMSPLDIMKNFDMGSYTKFKNYVIEHNNARAKQMESTRNEIEKRQNALLQKGPKNGNQ